MEIYDYLKHEAGKTTLAGGAAKIGLISLIFFGGYFGGADTWDRGMYSTKGVNIVRKEIDEMANGLGGMEFLEVNNDKLYIPSTDGKGNLRSIFRVDKVVLDLDGNKKYYEGVVFKLQEDGSRKVDIKSLEERIRQ